MRGDGGWGFIGGFGWWLFVLVVGRRGKFCVLAKCMLILSFSICWFCPSLSPVATRSCVWLDIGIGKHPGCHLFLARILSVVISTAPIPFYMECFFLFRNVFFCTSGCLLQFASGQVATIFILNGMIIFSTRIIKIINQSSPPGSYLPPLPPRNPSPPTPPMEVTRTSRAQCDSPSLLRGMTVRSLIDWWRRIPAKLQPRSQPPPKITIC